LWARTFQTTIAIPATATTANIAANHFFLDASSKGIELPTVNFVGRVPVLVAVAAVAKVVVSVQDSRYQQA